MVEQLQKTPSDNALRERIIKLSAEIKPAPAIPEEAREPFIMGATVLKKASDPAGAGKAVDLFTQALTIAPWFADAYYNRAIAREAAGQFEPAMDDLKFYLEFNLSDAERREAQDKIYELKANAQLASAKKVEEVKKQIADKFSKMSGKWKNGFGVYTIEIAADSSCTANLNAEYIPDLKVDNCKVVGDKLWLHQSSSRYNYWIECEFSLMPDGNMDSQKKNGGWSDIHQKVISSGCASLYRP
jgi:tetratricopeptide (TPR) repeat protein